MILVQVADRTVRIDADVRGDAGDSVMSMPAGEGDDATVRASRRHLRRGWVRWRGRLVFPR